MTRTVAKKRSERITASRSNSELPIRASEKIMLSPTIVIIIIFTSQSMIGFRYARRIRPIFSRKLATKFREVERKKKIEKKVARRHVFVKEMNSKLIESLLTFLPANYINILQTFLRIFFFLSKQNILSSINVHMIITQNRLILNQD